MKKKTHPATMLAAKRITSYLGATGIGHPPYKERVILEIEDAINTETEQKQLQIRVLVTVLKGLKRNGCWCDVSDGNPVDGEHCPACQSVRQIVEQAEGGTP